MPSTTDSNKVVDLGQYRARHIARAAQQRPSKSYVLWYPGFGAVLSNGNTTATPIASGRGRARVPEDAS